MYSWMFKMVDKTYSYVPYVLIYVICGRAVRCALYMPWAVACVAGVHRGMRVCDKDSVEWMLMSWDARLLD